MKSIIAYSFIFLAFFVGDPGWTKVIYVNHAATGENTGLSWTDAYTDLQEALASAEADDEIWVARGTYTPAEPDGARDRSFSLPDAVNVYGGFSGVEETIEKRVWNLNQTILSGDLNANDEEGVTESRNDNSYHVVSISGKGNTAVLDGFVICDGNANGNTAQMKNGGGVYIENTDRDEELGPAILNCVIRNNSTTPFFGHGGGIYIEKSKVLIENCVFVENSSWRGGALADDLSNLRLINCLFHNNSAVEEGGGIYHSRTRSFYTNCTIVSNVARIAGGIAQFSTALTMTNAVFWANRNNSGTVPNAYFLENTKIDSPCCEVYNYSIVQEIQPDHGSMVIHPTFINLDDPDGTDNLYFTDDDGLQLNRNSPGIDAGTSSTPDFRASDILNNERVDDRGITDTGAGTPDFVDLGAYERQSNSFYLLTVTHDGNGTVSSPESIEFVPGTLEPRINAQPNTGYEFDFWSIDQGQGVIADVEKPDTTINVSEDTTITAHFRIASLEFIIAETEPFLVPVGNSRVLNVSLSGPPAGSIAVGVSILAGGDPDVSIKGGSELLFTPEDWSEDHTIMLSAVDQDDTDTGIATLRLVRTSGTNPVVTRDVLLRINEEPTIRITSPQHGSTFTPPTSIEVIGEAKDEDGIINRIDIFANEVFVGEATYNADTDSWAFLFNREVEDTGEFLITAIASDDVGSTAESDPILLHVVDFIFTFTRPGPNETPVFAEDPYRFSWSIPSDLPRFDFNLYLIDRPQLTLEQIQAGDAEAIARDLNNVADKLGFTQNGLPVRPNQPETAWYPHILMNTGPLTNEIISGQHAVTVRRNVVREDVTIVIIDPKEDEDIILGQTIEVEALIMSENGNSITGSNAVIVRFKKFSEETPIAEIDESSDNGSVVLNDDFVPDSSGTWTVEIDWLGNVQFQPKVQARAFNVQKGQTTIDLAPLGQHVLGTELRLVGQLRIITGNPGGVDLSGLMINFELKDPNENTIPIPRVPTTNKAGGQNGRFETTISAEILDLEGDWTIRALTSETENFSSSVSDDVIIKVRKKVGYAILCQGSVPGNPPEGVNDHRRTIEYVKDTLLAGGRGMKNDPGSPNSLTDDVYEIGVGDPKAELEKAIKEWALPKMRDAPAPLYVILVNHGEANKFHMNANLSGPSGNILEPAEFGDWLDDLQTSLADPVNGNPLAAEEEIIVILGMCFSGSFIKALSKEGRVILSASAANERSIRGPGDSDSRHGELFVYLLFRELDNGSSLFDSFISSRDNIRQVSSQFELTVNGIESDFPGELGQHPLLDDNGDGKGNFILLDGSDDGEIAKKVFLITPTNSIGMLEIARNNPSLFLDPGVDPSGMLWAEADERPANGVVESIFMEVKKPGASDLEGTSSMQAGLELTPQLMNFNDAIRDRVRFEWPGLEPTLDLFDGPGMYQIFYYAKANADSQLSKPKVSFVFRGSGDFIPTPFKLLTPKDGAIVDFNPRGDDIENTLGLFRWEETHSPAGGVQYILRLWRDQGRTDLIFESEPLTPNFFNFLASGPASLPIGRYWWDVVAVDQKGNAQASDQLFEVTVIFTNTNPPATIIGDIRDKVSGEFLGDGVVEITGGEVFKLDQNKGKYIATVRSGPLYRITAKADGYEEGQPIEIKDVKPNDFIRRPIYLTRKANTGLLTVHTQPEGIPIADNVNANNQYPIALEIGMETEVTLTAPEFWPLSRQGFAFVGWRVGDSDELSDAITQTFQMDSDKTLTAEYEIADGMIFYPGWNLVSSPLVFDDSSVDNIFVKSDGTSFYHHGSVWSWQNNKFRSNSDLETGNGYWINSLETAFVPVSGSSPDLDGVSCNIGWNLVGVKGLQSISIPSDFTFAGKVWFWDGKHQQFLPVNSKELPSNQRDKLSPGHGYWMYCRD